MRARIRGLIFVLSCLPALAQAGIVGTVAFLASMQAGFIAGSRIQVEGGMLRGMV
jgi:NAD(P)-dependent dehydrogenase (short-subunit alcohol dehydrogenase family)